MTDTGVAITKGIETQLSAVASHLHELARAQTATGVELKEFKERLLTAVENLEDRVRRLEESKAELRAQVSALQSRQAPVSAPVAWVAVVISVVVAGLQLIK